MKKIILRWVIVSAVIFIGIQFIPYGRDHTNPAVINEPNWDSEATRELAVRGCFDCHSNETVWPWYSNIAPVSWEVYQDVERGRRELNFSEWGEQSLDVEEITEAISKDYMPLAMYLLMHPEARFTEAEKQQLIDGLRNSLE
jgi:hypothetical protein